MWCEFKKYKVADPLQTQQTRTSQNRYDYQVFIEIENMKIIEHAKTNNLQVDIDLKLMYFDDSLDEPKWDRLKQDTFSYDSELFSVSPDTDQTMFDLYCELMFRNPDFQKVIDDLFKRAHS